MYVGDLDADLRQGDILGPVQYWENPDTLAGTSLAEGMQSEQRLVEGYVVVLSHSCDVTEDNGSKRKRFLFAPLADLEEGTFAHRFREAEFPQDLNHLPEGATLYANVFFFEKTNAIDRDPDVGFIVDFTQTYVGKRHTRHETLVEAKVAQLTDEARAQLQTKLALHYARGMPTQIGED